MIQAFPFRSTCTDRTRSFSARLLIALVLAACGASSAAAQSEEIEPREVGGRGVMTIGLSGFVDKFSSSEQTFPLHVTAQVDVMRFLTGGLAVRGGLIGSTTTGDDDSSLTGPGRAALTAVAGALYYFTPRSIASLFAGGEYRAPLTSRAERDAGTVLGKAGVQAAVSSRVAFFVEGGYGVRLTRGTEDERQTRLVGELGVRIRF